MGKGEHDTQDLKFRCPRDLPCTPTSQKYVCQLQGNSPEIARVMVQSERTQCRKRRGKVHRLHCWAAGSPAATPSPPLAPSTSGIPHPPTLRPTQGLPASQRISRGITVPHHLCPTHPRRGMQRDVSQPHAGHFATLLQDPQIAQWGGSFSVLPRVLIARACPFPVQHRNPEAIAGDRAAPHLPGPGAER